MPSAVPGGQWAKDADGAWGTLAQRLKDARVTGRAGAGRLDQARRPRPGAGLHAVEYAKKLKDRLACHRQAPKGRYPNLRIAYLSSRIYGGYNIAGHRRVNPEPFAYESAFSVRWLIQDQIKGDGKPQLRPEEGHASSPRVLLWGPYLWADGDHAAQERRPGRGSARTSAGRRASLATRPQAKSPSMLLYFFKNDAGTKTWFVKK